MPERHRERGDHQVLPDPTLHRPTHDPPGVEVEHDREIQPPFRGAHVGDVAGPDLVRTVRAKVAVQHVASDGADRSPATGHPISLRDRPTQAGLSHQPRHAMPSHLVPPGLQLGVHARTPIRAVTLLMNPAHLSHQPTGRDGTGALGSPAPLVVAARRHRQQPGHHPDRILAAAGLDTAVSHRDSLAKNTAALFKNPARV